MENVTIFIWDKKDKIGKLGQRQNFKFVTNFIELNIIWGKFKNIHWDINDKIGKQQLKRGKGQNYKYRKKFQTQNNLGENTSDKS